MISCTFPLLKSGTLGTEWTVSKKLEMNSHGDLLNFRSRSDFRRRSAVLDEVSSPRREIWGDQQSYKWLCAFACAPNAEPDLKTDSFLIE